MQQTCPLRSATRSPLGAFGERYRRSGCVKAPSKGSSPLSALNRSHDCPRTQGLPIKTSASERTPHDGRPPHAHTERSTLTLPNATFTDLNLNPLILKALNAKGYVDPTPIQSQAIPGVMAGRDLLGIAQTGTGKTAAFALPILHRLAANRKSAPRGGCRCLVLSPTRELATQIAESFRDYGAELGFSVATVFGGVAHGPQKKMLDRGVDVLVAAPGRLLDHLGERTAKLTGVEIFVLDEADQMLDMGFIVPIRRIVGYLPKQRQNLFFSATMPADIGKLAGELLNDPLKVSVAPQGTTVDRVNQQVVFVEATRKKGLLVELFQRPDFTRVLVFTRTKRGADKVARILEGAGVAANAIHGNKSQNQRERALAQFKAGDVRALVATDIAARGIDISSVTHVVQFELPNVPESYVHRIGRTARAGAGGSAVAFCAEDERSLLRDIEKVTRQKIPAMDRRGDDALGRLTSSSPEAAGDAHVETRGPAGQRKRQGQRPPQRRAEGRADGREDYRGQSRQSADGAAKRHPRPPAQGDHAGKPNGKSRGADTGGGAKNRNHTNGQRDGQRDGQTRTGAGSGAAQGASKSGRDGASGSRGAKSPPRNDVVSGAGKPAGPMTPAGNVMQYLAAANPWSKG